MRMGLLLLAEMLLAVLLVGCGPVAPQTLISPSTTPQMVASSGSVEVVLQVTASPSPVALVEPTLEPTTTPVTSPTPALLLSQLTSGGCCVQPFWPPDSQSVYFIDRPGSESPAGLWGVDLSGSSPEYITDKLGIYSPDMQFRAFLDDGNTVVERLATGEQWAIPNGRRAVNFSPDGLRLAWTAGTSGPPFDTAQREIWVSNLDGSQARNVYTVTGGGIVGWFPDGRLLVNGRLESPESGQAYWALTLNDSEVRPFQIFQIDSSARVRGAEISPDGNWLVYMFTLDDDPSRNGLWLADTRTGQSRQLNLFGAYHWRDSERLLVVPLDLSQPDHRLFQLHAATGQVEALTDPAVTPFKIANGDWIVSPDGQRIAFVSAFDQNIWLLTIPQGR
jgi:Tol biopolymer transport system component